GPFAHGRAKSCMLRRMNEARSFSRSARLRPDRLIALLRMTIGESLRSKRFIMLALIQTLGGTLTMLVFIQSLTALEKQIAQQLGVGSPNEPGALIAEVMHSPDAQEFLQGIAGASTGLTDTSPLALMVGATLAFTLPLLVLFIVAPTLAADIGSGTS